MKRKNLKFVIGAVLIAMIIIAIFISVGSENMTYYFTPSEVLANPATHAGRKIRVMGLVKKNSIRWDPATTRLEFHISDEADQVLRVRYHGAKPDMFREGQGVVVEGELHDGPLLSASALLVKHNEEYKVAEHPDSKELYLKTMEF